MSGGSLDYLYRQIDYAIDRIRGFSKKPKYKALIKHLEKVSKALHDVEWTFSGDYGDDGDTASIKALLGEEGFAKNFLEAAIEDLSKATKLCEEAIGLAKELAHPTKKPLDF